MTTRTYAAIVLAAGFSSRMGEYKPLLTIGGETLVNRVISLFLNNNVDVILVTGWRREELISGIDLRGITIIENRDYKKGMFTSVLAGIGHLQPEHKAFFVMPVDIPLVRPATIRQMIKEAVRQPENVLYPVFGRVRGHPTLIPRSLIPEIKGWQKDGGLKAVLHNHEDMAREVTVADSYILLDVDTPEEYEALVKRFQTYEIPTEEECSEILTTICGVDAERRRHCARVSEAAVMIGQGLQASGLQMDLGLVRAAAALHDIAKGKPEHDIAGGKMLRDMGFDKVGEIVAVHSDLAGGNTSLSLEAKVVYLADKLVQGENPVTIEERYRSTGRRFTVTPEIEARIQARREVALKVQQEIEILSGYSMQLILDRMHISGI
jgi:molybdenum cofactor cytidylyltransferase